MFELSATYFIFFALLGVFLPYFNLYCRSIGFAPSEIGFFMSVFAAAKCLSPILYGQLADLTRKRKELMILAGWGGIFVFTGFFFTAKFSVMLALILLFGFFRSPLMPMVEATTWELMPLHGLQYGKIRLWGSIGFIVATLSAGVLVEKQSLRSILAFMLLLLFLQMAFLYRIRVSDTHGTRTRGNLKTLAKKIHLHLFLLIGFLTQLSHGMFYSFFSIHLKDIGFQESIVGICWTVSIICEVILMHNFDAWLKNVRPMKIIAVSGAVSALRWFILSKSSNLPLILASQSLHAITFAACHIASLKYLNENVPEGLKTTGQSLYSSLAFGMGIMAGSAIAGIIYGELGGFKMFQAAAFIALFTSLIAASHTVIFPKTKL